jgi:hypothetical protein
MVEPEVVPVVTISFEQEDDDLVVSKSNIDTINTNEQQFVVSDGTGTVLRGSIRKSSIMRKSGLMSPDDETVIKTSRVN